MLGAIFDVDPNIFHFVMATLCLFSIIVRGSVSGFSSRTQLLLLSCYACNMCICKWTSAYWWNQGVVVSQTLICLLFISNIRKYGFFDTKEKVLVSFIYVAATFVGFIHFENLVATNEQKWFSPFLLPNSGSMIFGEGAMDSGKQAFSKASFKYVDAHWVAFVIGYQRALQGLALLPQYRSCVFQQREVDWKIFAFTFVLGSYETYHTAAYFGMHQFLTYIQVGSLLIFTLACSGKVVFDRENALGVNSKMTEEECAYTISTVNAELAEIDPLMVDDELEDFL